MHVDSTTKMEIRIGVSCIRHFMRSVCSFQYSHEQHFYCIYSFWSSVCLLVYTKTRSKMEKPCV